MAIMFHKTITHILFSTCCLAGMFFYIADAHAITNMAISPAQIAVSDIKACQRVTIPLTTRYQLPEGYGLKIEFEDEHMRKWITIDDLKTTYTDDIQTIIPLTIDVPCDTPIGSYTTIARIALSGQEDSEHETQSFHLASNIGFYIPILIEVTDLDIVDMSVEWIDILETAMPITRYGITLHGYLTTALSLENNGNSPTSIRKLELDIYAKDAQNTKITTLVYDNTMPQINPFSKKRIFIDIPSYLDVGTYITNIRVYSFDQMKPKQTISVLFDVSARQNDIYTSFRLWISQYKLRLIFAFVSLVILAGSILIRWNIKKQ